MEYILQFFIYFLIHIYIKNVHNISGLQNASHNICRVRHSERNKKDPIVLASKLWDL